MDGIRRKMTNREIGLFWFFLISYFFFFWEKLLVWVCALVLSLGLLFWFGFGLCCACDIEEDGRRKR